MKRGVWMYVIPAVLFVAVAAGAVWLLRNRPQGDQGAKGPLTAAQKLYNRECLVCHGPTGEGNGQAAYLLYPKPRDFTKGWFKVRSTPSGQLPTDADLLAVLKRGMPGSAMPSFAHLSDEELNLLVSVVKGFAPAFAERQPTEGIAPPAPLPQTPENIARGKEVYAQMQCAACHGETGRADGLSSATLTDDWGLQIKANDFTRGIYKGGGRDEDIYLRFRTGMTGTPMPSYEGLLPDNDIYAVVQYVKSLAGDVPEAVQPQQASLTAAKVAGAVPEDPLSPAWGSAPSTSLPLMLLYQRRESSAHVDVKAVHNGKEVAILMEWSDAAVNAETIRPQDFSDGGGVQFALRSDVSLESLTMGAATTPVNIWYWRASRQMDLVAYADVEAVYPNVAPDGYLQAKPFDPKEDESKRHDIPAAASYDKTYLTALGAGNPVSNPTRTVPMEDLNAEGFGSLTTQPDASQNVRGAGVWDNGKWKVVFVRPLASPDQTDAKLTAGKQVPVAFAVWDGGQGDRNGQKSVTNWNLLTLAP